MPLTLSRLSGESSMAIVMSATHEWGGSSSTGEVAPSGEVDSDSGVVSTVTSTGLSLTSFAISSAERMLSSSTEDSVVELGHSIVLGESDPVDDSMAKSGITITPRRQYKVRRHEPVCRYL